MNESERQVAPTLDGIRRDHRARYEFAARQLAPGSRVIDFACGVGYGTMILAAAGHHACGYDIDQEALDYAQQHYGRVGTSFRVGNGNAPGELGEADAAVCFETIEHLEDPRPLLLALRQSAPLLIASVPNEAVMPYEFAPGKVYAYHHRHYLKNEFHALLQECGWCVTQWHGQASTESDVLPDMPGRTLVVVAQRDELPPQQAEGKHVAILGLGPSIDQFVEITKRKGGRSAFCDEVWGINALGDVFACDLVFHMDDVRIQEIRAAANPAGNIAAMLPWLKTSKAPVVTSRSHPDYPPLVDFPLEEVLNHLGHDYFNSTAAYAVAFAIHIGVAKISLFGIDYTLPNQHQAEKGRACVEYWLGQAAARGIKIMLPKSTTLMDAQHSRAERLYGYDTLDVKFDIQSDGQLKLEMTERASLPTAAQIEKSYDHSAPIAKQHLAKETP
jgi:SAM-dependent methyltransferase